MFVPSIIKNVSRLTMFAPDDTPAGQTPEQIAAAAAAAAGDKTPEQIAADAQAATDAAALKAANDKIADDAQIAADAAALVIDPTKLTLPTDALLTPDDVTEIAAKAKILGLSHAQAQALVTHEATHASAMATQFLKELEADPDLGGSRLEASKELTRRGVAYVASVIPARHVDFLTQFFEKSGFGNHPAFVAMLAHLGSARAEDTPINGSVRRGTDPERKRDADVIYAK